MNETNEQFNAKAAVYDWAQRCQYLITAGMSADEAIAQAKEETEPRGPGFWMAVLDKLAVLQGRN